ncbi:hypothetical protein [Ferribacterium limneticum]|nr:hypothetical protein [Ferribacterium limneticum]
MKSQRSSLFRRLVLIWTGMGDIWMPLSVARELWRAAEVKQPSIH